MSFVSGSALWHKIEASVAAREAANKTETLLDNHRCWRAEEAKRERIKRRNYHLRAIPLQPGERIIREVCKAHELPLRVLLGHRRDKRISEIRRKAYWRLYAETEMSTTQIGKLIGKRDHTSVIHGLERYMLANGITERPAHRVKG